MWIGDAPVRISHSQKAIEVVSLTSPPWEFVAPLFGGEP
jgi:hypothetical protein